MGKFCEMSDGVFLLEVKIGSFHVKRAFIPAEKKLSEVSEKPMQDGFYLYIPDHLPEEFSSDDENGK